MRSPADSLSCSQAPRKRLLLVGGFTVPAIVLGSLLGAAPAMAVGGVNKADITTAFGAATSTNSTVQLTDSLTDPAEDGTSDVQTLGGGKSLTIDLAGKALDLDQIRVAAGATLTITDPTGGGSLLLASTPLTAGDSSGVTLAPGAHLVVTDGATLTSTGSGSLPGVGTTAATGSAATVDVTDGASLTALGGTGAAGVGGTVPTTVTVDHASLTATGGAGAAGIGGSIGKGGSTVTLNHGATVSAHEGAASGSTTPAASAIGNGQGSSSFGSLTVADSASVLTVPAGAALRIPNGTTVDNHGEIDVLGTLGGTGTITNEGSIIPSGSGAVASGLQVTGNDYAVTLDAGTSGTVTPTTARVLSDTFAHGSVALPDAVADSAHYFNGWKSTSTTVDRTTDLSTVAGTDTAANGALAVSLTADYDTQLSFTQDTDLGLLNTTTAVSTQLLAGGSGSKTWSQPSTGVPAGLTLSSSGLLSGTPTATGTFSFTTTVTGPHGTADRTYTGSVGVVPVMADTTLANATVGSSYSRVVAATSGTDGTTYSAPAGSLPAGLSLASDGTITGTPTTAAAGSVTFTVTATNLYGTSHADYTVLTHTIPVFTTATLPSAVLGTSYSKQLGTTGDGTITYALDPSTPLPGTMTVSSSGLISGTATRAGSRNITVIATSEYGSTSKTYVFVAGDVPAITTATLPNTTVGAAYSQQLTTTGDGTVTWSASGLNNGLSLSSSGLLSGTVGAAGSDTFTVTSTSSFGTVEKDFTIVAGAKPTISTSSIGDAIQGVAYTDSIVATGTGTTAYSATGLPAGVSIDSGTGALTGTPTASGSFTVHVTATNSWGATSHDFTIAVHVAPSWVTATTLPDVSTTTAVDQNLSAPGDGTVTYTSSNLPGTLTLTPAGHLTGTVASGTTTFTVRATNSYGHADQTFSIHAGVAPAITTVSSDLAAPIVNHSGYSATIAATGDDDPTFAVTAGALPDGLHLNGTTGAITGTATTVGAFSFVVTATSHWGTDVQTFTGLVGDAPLFTASTLPGATFGQSYDHVIPVLAAGSGVTYSVSAGTLPDGLTLQGSHITGQLATDATASTFTITVHSIYGDTDQQFTITPGIAAHITTASADLGSPVAGRSFTGSIAGDGTGVVYSVTGGALPDGLTLHADGSITGTPTSTGAAHFIVTARSAYGNDTATYDLTVGAAPSFTTDSLGQAIVGIPFLKTLVTAGDGTIALHVQGALPAGITFDPTTGTLAGTPTAAGTSTVTIVAVSDLATTPHDYTFTAFAAPALATTALSSGTAGSAYSTFVRATGSGDVTYAVSAGSLPDGLALNARTGALTGTPTAAGTATFTVSATSAYGTDSKQLTLTVDAAPVVTPPVTTPPASSAPVTTPPASSAPVTTPPASSAPVTTPPVVAAPSLPVAPKATAELGHGFALSVAADSTVPVTYSVKGDLPKGVSLNAKTGMISGTAKESGSFTFTIKAVTSAGSDSQKYTVVVPEIVNLVQGSANWITPVQGQAMDVSIAGLKKGEHWTVKANGKTVKTGTAAKAGTVTTSITLKKSLTDKRYVIAVSGSRTVTDPAKTASDEFTVTAITGRKSLKVQRAGTLVKVVNFAPREIVALKIDGKVVATGRADDKGLFVHTVKSWSKGTHQVTVTGKTTTRTGKLTVKITK